MVLCRCILNSRIVTTFIFYDSQFLPCLYPRRTKEDREQAWDENACQNFRSRRKSARPTTCPSISAWRMCPIIAKDRALAVCSSCLSHTFSNRPFRLHPRPISQHLIVLDIRNLLITSLAYMSVVEAHLSHLRYWVGAAAAKGHGCQTKTVGP